MKNEKCYVCGLNAIDDLELKPVFEKVHHEPIETKTVRTGGDKYNYKNKKYRVIKKKPNMGEAFYLRRKKKSLRLNYGNAEFQEPFVCKECKKNKDADRRRLETGSVYVLCLECGVERVMLPSSDCAKNARKDAKANKSEHVQLIFDSCTDHE